jgi:hypothetical protein
MLLTIYKQEQNMKNSIAIITAVIVLTFSGLALAEMEKGKDMMMGEKGMGMMKGDMMCGKMKGMCPMMQSMMQKSVVAMSDGGIIVVTGNKLTKYDKDLNVVKEDESKMDMEGMRKMMEHVKGMCPMMHGMKGMDEKSEDVHKEHQEEQK